jgi:hypothetical protein
MKAQIKLPLSAMNSETTCRVNEMRSNNKGFLGIIIY